MFSSVILTSIRLRLNPEVLPVVLATTQSRNPTPFISTRIIILQIGCLPRSNSAFAFTSCRLTSVDIRACHGLWHYIQPHPTLLEGGSYLDSSFIIWARMLSVDFLNNEELSFVSSHSIYFLYIITFPYKET